MKLDAIPLLNLNNMIDEDMESIDYLNTCPPEKRRRSCESDLISTCNNCEKYVKARDFYMKKYNTLLKKYTALRVKTKTNKKNQTANKSKIFIQNIKKSIDSLPHISSESKIFCKLLISSAAKKYTPEVKNLAQNIFYVSQSSYNFLRNKLHLNLPHVSSLHPMESSKITSTWI